MNIELTDERFSRGLVNLGNNENLKRFIEDISKERKLVYGAIGGSITEGSAADPHANCYAERFASWLDEKCASGCKLVNAGIGASNSLFGTFRANRDLLSHQPDIITIEYAVNDSTNPDTAVAYESLVHKCLLQPNKPAVILIFTMKRDGSNRQEIHEKIGHYYNLPMLSYRDAIYPDITAGKLAWEDISPDEVHPNNCGHRFIADMLIRLTEEVEATQNSESDAKDLLPLNPECEKYANGMIADAEKLEVISVDGWTKGPHKGGYTGWQTETPGATIEFSFTGKIAFTGHKQYAGDFGRAELTLDDKDPVILEGFYEKPPIQAWAGGHTVLNSLLESDISQTHRLKIRLLEEKHPESTGHKFDFGYLLIG